MSEMGMGDLPMVQLTAFVEVHTRGGEIVAADLRRRIALAVDAMGEALLAFEVRYDANIGVEVCAQLRAALEVLR